MVPSEAISSGSGSSQSRRSGDHVGGSYGTSTHGHRGARERTVEVRHEPEPVRPRVRRPAAAVEVAERGDAPAAAEPADEEHVGLDDVDEPAHREIPRVRGVAHELPGCDPDAARGAQRRVPRVVVGSERLLEPVDAELLERPRALDRRRDVPPRRAVAGHAPALVRVDHDLEPVADGLAHAFDHREVRTPVAAVEPELDRAHASLGEREAPLGTLRRLDGLSGRRVGEQPLAAAAEELPDRLLERPADDVPDRDLDCPRTSAVEVDGLADLPHGLRPEGVDTDEQPLELSPVGEAVSARGDAGDAGVGVDEDDRRLLLAFAARGPRRRGTGGRAGSGRRGSRRR